MKVLKWVLLLPSYCFLGIIVWLVCVFLINFLNSFSSIIFWLTVPAIFIIGGIIVPISLPIAVIEHLDLPIKPALIVILINNLLGVLWTFNHGGYILDDLANIFGAVFSFFSISAVIVMLFINYSGKKDLTHHKKSTIKTRKET